MDITKITEKLKDVLSADDLNEIQDTIKSMVSEQVETRVEVEVDRLENLAEEYCQKQIDEKVSEVKKELEEAKEKEIDALEESVVDKLDKFLDLEISSKINEDTLKSIAINETLEPLVKGIANLFENKYVALDTEGEGLLRKSKEQIDKLEEKVADLVNEKMELSETAEKAACKLLIAEKTQELTEVERDRVSTMAEGKDFEELFNKIDTYVDIVLEGDKKDGDIISEDTDVSSEEECLSEHTVDVRAKDSDGSEKIWENISKLL